MLGNKQYIETMGFLLLSPFKMNADGYILLADAAGRARGIFKHTLSTFPALRLIARSAHFDTRRYVHCCAICCARSHQHPACPLSHATTPLPLTQTSQLKRTPFSSTWMYPLLNPPRKAPRRDSSRPQNLSNSTPLSLISRSYTTRSHHRQESPPFMIFRGIVVSAGKRARCASNHTPFFVRFQWSLYRSHMSFEVLNSG